MDDLLRSILGDPLMFTSLVILWFIIIRPILYPEEVHAGWRQLTDRVMDLLDRWWIINYLPAEQGGEDRYTIKLGDGERVEFVLARSGKVKWFTWSPFPDPEVRGKKDGERGYAPLVVWFLAAPLLALSLATLAQAAVSFANLDFEGFAVLPPGLAALSLLVAGIALVPIYWTYEWCRLHEYWFQTSYWGYLVCFRPFGRMTRPVSPVAWMKDTRIRSLWSDKPFPLAQIGGVITHTWDFGTILIGSIAYGPFFDFLSAWPKITAFQEILVALPAKAAEMDDYKKTVHGMTVKFRLEGVTEEALRGVTSSGESPLGLAHRKIAAIEAEYRANIAQGGEEVNLADWRAWLGFTRWALSGPNAGEELPAPIKIPV